MSKTNFEEKLMEIRAIPDADVKKTNMPVGEAVQESENLFAWSMMDQVQLTKSGLDLTLIQDLPLRAGALRYAQSLWARESKSREEAQKEWKEKAPEAFDFRDQLLHDFTFAYRKLPEQLAKVQTIREGSSNADMLQDFSDMNVLGKDNPESLTKIGFDLIDLDRAAETVDQLSAVLALANGEEGDDVDAKELRDKAYTFMKMAVDEIRNTGQYVFWRDEDRKKGYVSAYQKRLNQRRKGGDSANEDFEPGK
jgi:hypothetical protein